MRKTIGWRRALSNLLRSAGGKRFRWGIVDQWLSSLTNFLVTAVAAHEVGPKQFGAFAFAFALYVLFLSVGRSLVAEPFVVRFTRETEETRHQAARRALGASVALGLVAMVITAAIAGLAWSSSGHVLLVMAVAAPALLMQDAYRFVFIASGRSKDAAINDGLWLVAQLLGMGILLVSGIADAVSLMAAFGAAAAFAALVAAWQVRLLPSVGSARNWFSHNKDLGLTFLYETIVINGMPQVALLGIAAAGSVVIVGELRATALLLSPLSVVFAGTFFVALPEAVRMARRSVDGVERLVVTIGLFATASTALWCSAIALVPNHWGQALLSKNWDLGRSLLVPVGVLTIASTWMLAIAIGLRALDGARRSLRFRSMAVPLIMLGGALGAALAGAKGAALGLMLPTCLNALLAWIVFRRILRERSGRTMPVSPS